MVFVIFLQALDGKVERDENGKEIRHPVLLTAQEKLIARKVCMAFKVFIPVHRRWNQGGGGDAGEPGPPHFFLMLSTILPVCNYYSLPNQNHASFIAALLEIDCFCLLSIVVYSFSPYFPGRVNAE